MRKQICWAIGTAVFVAFVYFVYCYWRGNKNDNNEDRNPGLWSRVMHPGSSRRSRTREDSVMEVRYPDDLTRVASTFSDTSNHRHAEKVHIDSYPPGYYHIKVNDRFLEPSSKGPTDTNLVSRVTLSGVWQYNNHKLIFEWNRSNLGSCLTSHVEGDMLITKNINLLLQKCDGGTEIILDKKGRIYFANKGFFVVDLTGGFRIDPQKYTKVDILPRKTN